MKVASHVLEGEIERLKRVVANRDETIERLTQQVTAMRAPAFLFPSEWDLSAVEAAILAGLISRKVASREYLLAESRMAATVRAEVPRLSAMAASLLPSTTPRTTSRSASSSNRTRVVFPAPEGAATT